MTDISDIRRKNLLKLRRKMSDIFHSIDENINIRYTNKIFCQSIGITPTEYNQLFNMKVKPVFSEMFARRIESNCGLDSKWLDNDYDDIHNLNINFDKFSLGTKSLIKFNNKNIVNMENEDILNNILINLFNYLSESGAEITEISDETFLEFLKSK